MNTEQILSYWRAHMRAQNCTERTISERMIFAKSLLKHAGSDDLLTLTKYDLIAFLGKTDAMGRQLTGKTKQNYRSTLHTLFTWIQDEEFRLDNPAARLPRPRVEHTEPNPVTTAELQQLLDSGIYGRTRMMVVLYAYEGLRASEIAAVAGSNIDWIRRRLLTVEGKGRKEVWRPMHSLTWEEAQAFPRLGFWFPGQHGHVRGKSVSATLSAAFKRAGLETHTGHDMRAWHATTQLEAGVDSLTVRYSMRHTDGQSIDKYDQPSDGRISDGRETLPRVVVPITSARRRRDQPGPIAA